MIGSGLSKPARGQIQFDSTYPLVSSLSKHPKTSRASSLSLSLISQMEAKLYVSHSSFPLSYLVSQSKRKTLKVADLKEICTRANVPTTTRLTKADLITKILASQPAIDAYNAKYKQNGNAAPSSNPAPPSTHDDIVSRNASL